MPDIECPACQKQYAWKAELSGKRLKCRCGFTFAAAAQSLDDFDDLLALQASAPLAPAALQPAAVGSSGSAPMHISGPLNYRHDRCGTLNQMSAEVVAETQADPRSYRAGVIICGHCGVVPDRECTLERTGEKVSTFNRRMWQNKSWIYHMYMPAIVLLGIPIGALAGFLYFGDWPALVFGIAGAVIAYRVNFYVRHALAMRGMLP